MCCFYYFSQLAEVPECFKPDKRFENCENVREENGCEKRYT